MSISKVNAGKQQTGAYRREMKANWWTKSRFYNLYMLREATAIFMLIFTIFLIFGLGAVSKGKEAFLGWADFMSAGVVQWFSVVALFMALYHTATWFAATPKVMPLQKGDKKVPAHLIVAGNWVALFVIAIIVFVLAGI